jgi:single-strand DNA-binding protein
MAAFNKVILIGNLCADPELKTTPNGVSVTSFRLAVGRKFSSKDQEPQTDFINCVAWRGTAEFICKYFQKGKSILIVGSIQTRSWDDQNGQKQYATEVVADEAQFVEKKSESAAMHSPSPNANSSNSPYSSQSVGFEEMTSEDLPF